MRIFTLNGVGDIHLVSAPATMSRPSSYMPFCYYGSPFVLDERKDRTNHYDGQ
ncbi:hypothetical protein ABIE66_004627 [Peribacillus sp. B2I2]|jgi:hypothetical protein